MKTFRTLLAAAILCCPAALAEDAPPKAPPKDAPNILVIVADDLGWGDVGFHKGATPTPQLDRLAKEGLELQRFYTYPVCSPTRAALITGQMPRRFGITDVVAPRQNLPEGISTLPGTLRAAGYRTGLIGKWHLGTSGVPQKNGFDHFYGFLGPQIDYFAHTNPRGDPDWQRDGKPLQEKGYSTYLFADEAIRQIKQREPGHPFFIEVAFNAVHIPHGAPEELVAKYKSLPANQATYAAVIEAMDTSVGRILAALDAEGLRDDTIVLFFSDNGAGGRGGGSNAPLRGGKSSLFEGGIREPCLLRWPGQVPAGGASRQPMSVHDVFPTLAAMAGAQVKEPAKLDGKNQWDALRAGRVQDRGPFVIATADCALFDGDWKLIETADGKRSLFQLADDPGETTDLLARQPEIARRLTGELAEMKKDLPTVRARQQPGASGRSGGARQGPGGGQGRPPGRGNGNGPAAK